MNTEPLLLDYSEFTEAEIAEWDIKIRESLGNDYLAHVRLLLASDRFPTTDEGWERLQDQAVDDAMESNVLCQTVSAISAQRRVERFLRNGGIEDAPQQGEVTVAGLERTFRALSPAGELHDSDGRPLSQADLEELARLLNNPVSRREALSGLSINPSEIASVGAAAYRVTLEAFAARQKPIDVATESVGALAALALSRASGAGLSFQ